MSTYVLCALHEKVNILLSNRHGRSLRANFADLLILMINADVVL